MNQEEQLKELQEKLAKMSPEELQEFWKARCIFCQIIDNKVESKKVYEDEVCVAVLDINPAVPGHVLLMPKQHFTVGPQVPDDITAHLGKVSSAISKACLQALKCKGTTIFMANGAAAGQVAQHFMIHIIPRYEKEDIPQLSLPKHSMDEAQLDQLTEQLRQYIEQKLNIKITEEETKEVPKEEPVKEKLKREPGYLYFLDKELNIKRVKSGRKKGKAGKKEVVKKNAPKEVSKEKVPDLDDISRLFT